MCRQKRSNPSYYRGTVSGVVDKKKYRNVINKTKRLDAEDSATKKKKSSTIIKNYKTINEGDQTRQSKSRKLEIAK